jgi:hypothetical protein
MEEDAPVYAASVTHSTIPPGRSLTVPHAAVKASHEANNPTIERNMYVTELCILLRVLSGIACMDARVDALAVYELSTARCLSFPGDGLTTQTDTPTGSQNFP